MPRKSPTARLIWACSEISADLFYATRFFAPDPYGWLEWNGKTYLLVNNLELSRAQATAKADFFSSIQEFSDPLRKNPSAPAWATLPAGIPLEHAAIVLWLRHCNAPRHIFVPDDFPLALARNLEKSGYRVLTANQPFFPDREFKLQQEVEAIRKACAIAAAGIWRALDILRQSSAAPNRILYWRNHPLTADNLRAEIDSAVLRAGGQPGNTIVACGNQSCDPHERGHGPLYLSELIILDVFPRDPQTGYYGDLTRTVVRGPASEAQRALWQTCLEAQENAISQLHPGTSGSSIHQNILSFFHQKGFPTEKRNDRWVGFFHGTGHGLGLELHESPRLQDAQLQPGHVFTVEPGLYYPDIGGVRHEDVVHITPNGPELLTNCPRPFEI